MGAVGRPVHLPPQQNNSESPQGAQCVAQYTFNLQTLRSTLPAKTLVVLGEGVRTIITETPVDGSAFRSPHINLSGAV